jgi:chromosome partitioning protein
LTVIAVANQKGGVGKTATALGIAICLARRDRRVLVVDCDPQATLTRQAGIDTGWLQLSLVDVLAGRAAAADAVIHDIAPGVSVLPAARELAGVEMALVAELGRERFLGDALDPIRGRFEQLVIDTPPNLGLLTVNALVSADLVLAPVSAEDEAAVQGLAELRSTLVQLDRLIGAKRELAAILTRWAPRRVLGMAIADAVAELGVPILARVPARAAVGHAAAHRVPLAVTAPDGAVSLAYARLADRLVGVSAR